MKEVDKVVKFGKGKARFEDEILEIAKVIADGTPPAETSKVQTQAQAQASKSYVVTGDSNIVGEGNFINSGSIHINTPPPKTKVYVQTGVGVIDAKQKKQLMLLVYELVDTHNAIKKSKLSYGAAWRIITLPLDVNSYHEIKKDDYEKAVKILRSKLGILRSMASAPKKLDNWRPKTIQSIQTRCSKNGWQLWRKEYMLKTFSKESTKELTDDELDRLYRAVWNKK